MTTNVIVNLRASTATPAGNYNNIAGPTSTGLKSSNLINTSGGFSNLSLYLDVAFVGSISNAAWASTDLYGWPVDMWQSSWYSNNSTSSLRVVGFPPNKTGLIRIAGLSGNATRDSKYILNGVTNSTVYDAVASGTSPNQWIEIPFTANSNGEVSISGVVLSSYWYIDGFELVYLEPSIVTMGNVVAGQTSTVTINDPTYVVSNISLSDGMSFINATSLSGSGTDYTISMPDLVDNASGLRLGSLSVVATNGSIVTPAFTATYSKPNLTAVNLISVSPDNIGTNFVPALQVGDQLAGNPSTITFNDDGTADSNFIGSQTCWHYSSLTHKWYSFDVIGALPGAIPNQLSFVGITAASLNTVYTSNPITVTGVDAGIDVPISISGGSYSIDTGSGFGAFITTPSTIQLNNAVKVRTTSASAINSVVTVTLTIGGVQGTYTVSTVQDLIISLSNLQVNGSSPAFDGAWIFGNRPQ